jgi:TP53 regulating kinase-like protein
MLIADVSQEAAAAKPAIDSMYLIDFGLSYKSDMAEDRAVDLYVLERAVTSTHPSYDTMFVTILEGYKRASKRGDSTTKKLSQVRARGRKRLAFG